MKLQTLLLPLLAAAGASADTTTDGGINLTSLLAAGTSVVGSLASDATSVLSSLATNSAVSSFTTDAASKISSIDSALSSGLSSVASNVNSAAHQTTTAPPSSTGAAGQMAVPVAGGMIGAGLVVLGML